MADGQKIDVMNELLKIGFEFLRKQAGMVIVLLAVCAGLIWFMLEQKRELYAQMLSNKVEYKEAMAAMSGRLDHCETARANLVVEVEVLKVQMAILTSRKK